MHSLGVFVRYDRRQRAVCFKLPRENKTKGVKAALSPPFWNLTSKRLRFLFKHECSNYYNLQYHICNKMLCFPLLRFGCCDMTIKINEGVFITFITRSLYVYSTRPRT